jgi:hypothetical protein
VSGVFHGPLATSGTSTAAAVAEIYSTWCLIVEGLLSVLSIVRVSSAVADFLPGVTVEEVVPLMRSSFEEAFGARLHDQRLRPEGLAELLAQPEPMVDAESVA